MQSFVRQLLYVLNPSFTVKRYTYTQNYKHRVRKAVPKIDKIDNFHNM